MEIRVSLLDKCYPVGVSPLTPLDVAETESFLALNSWLLTGLFTLPLLQP